MNPVSDNALAMSFADAERAQLRVWMTLDASAKIDFFEEMIELAFSSGALQPHRLALRDAGPVVATAVRSEACRTRPPLT